MERVSRLIVYRPWFVLALIALLTVFFGYYARQIRIDSSVESLLPAGDPEKRYYDEVRQLFGRDDVGVIGIITDQVYTPETFQKIQRLTAEIRKIPEVKNALSLMNAPDPIAKVVGEENDLLVSEIPATPEEWDALKQKIADRPIF